MKQWVLQTRSKLRLITGALFIVVMVCGLAVEPIASVATPSPGQRIVFTVLLLAALVSGWVYEFRVVPSALQRLGFSVRSLSFVVPFALWAGGSFMMFILASTLGFMLTPVSVLNSSYSGVLAIVFAVAALGLQVIAFVKQVAAVSEGATKRDDGIHNEWFALVYASITYVLVWSIILLNGTLLVAGSGFAVAVYSFILLYVIVHRVRVFELLRYRVNPQHALVNALSAMAAVVLVIVWLV